MLYVFSSHCYCHPVIYSLSLFIIYSVNSFIANFICYITIPSLNKVLYLVSCILYLNFEVDFGVNGAIDTIVTKWAGAPNSARFRGGGVNAEGHPRFDKGGVAIIFYFLRVN